MAATQILVPQGIEGSQPQQRSDAVSLLATAGLTAIAVLIHGYHPYAEDGGIYLPGILKLIHPELYPTWTGFVTGQMRFSLFARTIAAFVQMSGISVMFCLFCVYFLSIWGTLQGVWLIAVRCLKRQEARYGAVVIVALCISAPAAGTSLLLMDPYVTARSISTPLGLLAIAATLDFVWEFRQSGDLKVRSLILATISLLIAALMHPLMASYIAGCLALLVCASISGAWARNISFAALALFAILLATLVHMLAPAPPSGYAAVALSRDYWFLSNWRWYEIAGLVAPLLLLCMLARNTSILSDRGRWLARAGFWAGLIGLEISLLFAHRSAHNYFVAMLQPLRFFHVVYILFLLLLGGMLGGIFLKTNAVRWAATCLTLGALMFFVQIQTFPHSSHIELPWRAPANDWERGFTWIRNNTPADATFALDWKYIDSPGEDSQIFRAIAERSVVPDYIKDGGIAAVDPALTPQWTAGRAIQAGLATLGDAGRRAHLAQAHIRWLVLPYTAATSFDCPYKNGTMKVCRIP